MCDSKVMRKAYKAIMLKCHPDKVLAARGCYGEATQVLSAGLDMALEFCALGENGRASHPIHMIIRQMLEQMEPEVKKDYQRLLMLFSFLPIIPLPGSR